MAAVSAWMVKELRDRTGLGMMDCKKALVEADGAMDKAIETLRKSSGLKAAKKASRTANDGLVGIRISDDSQVGVLVEVNCETDFAAKDENFRDFVTHARDLVFDSRESDIAKLLADGLEVEREALVQKIGENVSVRRAEVIEVTEGSLCSYVHTNGKIGVLLAMTGGSEDLGRDLAMHIAATDPLVVAATDAPADLVAKEREIYTAQAEDSGKPAEIVEKMIDGRIRKFLAEISLLEQPFVKDDKVKVAKLLDKEGAAVTRFARYLVGDGIEKEEEDFAAEVQNQLKDS